MKEHQELLNLGFAMGQNHAFGTVAGRCSAAQAETLRRIREEKLYIKLTPTWKEFCGECLGMSNSHADHIIRLLQEFGPNYFALAQLTKISPDVYRAIAPAVKDGLLEHNGETIELAPENTKKVAAAVNEMRREVQKKLPPPPPEPAARLDELDKRFESLLRDFAEIPDSQRRWKTLRLMMERLGSLVVMPRM
jgi:hypothetical protein